MKQAWRTTLQSGAQTSAETRKTASRQSRLGPMLSTVSETGRVRRATIFKRSGCQWRWRPRGSTTRTWRVRRTTGLASKWRVEGSLSLHLSACCLKSKLTNRQKCSRPPQALLIWKCTPSNGYRKVINMSGQSWSSTVTNRTSSKNSQSEITKGSCLPSTWPQANPKRSVNPQSWYQFPFLATNMKFHRTKWFTKTTKRK